jgi:hypothetical protein
MRRFGGWRLGITPTMLAIYLADKREVPDSLVLQTVDIIIEDRQSRMSLGWRTGPAQAGVLDP